MFYLKKIIISLTHFLQVAKQLSYQILQKILPKPIKQILSKVINFREQKIISQNKFILSELLKNYLPGKDYRTIIIFPPSLDWDVQLFQRPQQLALALAKQGALVFYTQPKPDRNFPPFELISERLYLCKVHVDTFQIISEPNIYLLTWNSNYATRFTNPRIIYDFVDDIDVFYGDKVQIKKGHEYLLKNAKIVLATAIKLVEEAKHFRSDVIYSPNGVVYDHFANVESQEQVLPPSDLVPLLKMQKPIIGYYGALARWFDYELLKGIAQRRQDYLFVLIGPDYDGTMKHAGISHLENIYWLGVKQYAELPFYLHFFDVATIPFLVNDITHATSPLKLFEYMAGGKPIVITPMHESMQYEGVLVADGPDEFVEKLDQTLLISKDSHYINEIKKLALQNTWESRAEEIIVTIENC
ncbi:MAG: glycosyltransferase [Anaerolineaceae bacterium]|nr:glycosyltransferase [Anaerolineaceae bacterium]